MTIPPPPVEAEHGSSKRGDTTASIGASVFDRVRIAVLGNAASKVCLLGFEFGAAMFLGVADYGHLSIAIALIILLASVGLLGLNYGVIQYLAIHQESGSVDRQESVVRASLATVFLFSLALAGGLFVASDFLANRVFDKPALADILRIVSLIVPVEALNQCMSAIFRGLRRQRDHVLVLDLIRNVVLLTALPAVALVGYGVPEALLFFLAGSLIGTAFGLSRLARDFALMRAHRGDGPILRDLLGFSHLMFLWNILQSMANRGFLLLCGILLTSEEMGGIAIVLRLVLLLQFLQTGLNMSAPVEFARLNHLGDRATLSALFRSISEGLLILSIPIALLLVVDPTALVGAFGQGYVPFAWTLWPLALAALTSVGTGPVGELLINCRRQRAVMALAAADAAFQFLVVVPLMHVYGLPGAVAGEVARVVIVTVALRHAAMFRLVGIHLLTAEYGLCWLTAAVCLVPAALLGSLIEGWEGAAAALLYGLAVYAVLGWFVLRRRVGGAGLLRSLLPGGRGVAL